jgi:membrane-associated phospholipid phosphatase
MCGKKNCYPLDFLYVYRTSNKRYFSYPTTTLTTGVKIRKTVKNILIDFSSVLIFSYVEEYGFPSTHAMFATGIPLSLVLLSHQRYDVRLSNYNR